MSRTKLTWSRRPETSSASAAVGKYALPRQKGFATDSPKQQTFVRTIITISDIRSGSLARRAKRLRAASLSGKGQNAEHGRG